MTTTIPVKNIYYLLCYAWDRLEEGALVDISAVDGYNLSDLFARVLVSGTKHLLRRGLDQGYLPEEAELAGVRGRISIEVTARRMLGAHGRAHCRFDELRVDTLPNQILKSTVLRLLRLPDLAGQLRSDLAILTKELGGISEIRLSKAPFRRVQLHGNKRFYRFLLDICELIFESTAIDESTGERHFRDFVRDERRMARLFEDFVFNFYRRERPDLDVRRDHIAWAASSADDPELKYLPTMRTDISIRDGSRTLIIDTKYYKEVFQSYFDKQTIHSGNLYQLFSYLKNLEAANANAAEAVGMLLYPVMHAPVKLRYTLHSHSVCVCTVDLAEEWTGIRRQLLDLVESLGG
jgi:5-methylcytosine-specific restriction enzyme subunit McrC